MLNSVVLPILGIYAELVCLSLKQRKSLCLFLIVFFYFENNINSPVELKPLLSLLFLLNVGYNISELSTESF